VYRIYSARCMNIFNSLLAQLVKYDVYTTRKINSIHAIIYHILSLYRNKQQCTKQTKNAWCNSLLSSFCW